MTFLDYQQLRITPDTNVCVSGAIVSHGASGRIIRAWRHDEIAFALCEPILSEVREVLQRPYFAQRVGWKPDQIVEYVSELREGSELYPATTPVQISPDPDDNVLFACAVEAQADYIVSGDKAHVLSVRSYEGIDTISPHDFVEDFLTAAKAS